MASKWIKRLKQIMEAKKTDPTLNPMLVSTRLAGGQNQKFGGTPKIMRLQDIAAEDPDVVPKIADTLRGFHIAGPESQQPKDPKEFLGMVGERMKSNIQATLRRHEVLNPEVLEKSQDWYDSAHGFARHLSERHGVKLDTAAAVIAALSPSADWNDNAAGAAHHMEFFFKDIPEGRGAWTPEMTGTAERMVGQNADLRLKKGVTDPSEMAKQVAGVRGKGVHDILKGRTAPSEIKDEEFEQLGTLGRIFIDSHHPREMRESLPGGGFGQVMRTAAGEPRKLRHQSTDNLAKVYKIMMADKLPDEERLAVHSEALGGGPKVRSFNDNILQPNADLPISTMDTHSGALATGDPTETSTRATAMKKMGYPDTSFHKVYTGIIMGGAPKSKKSGNVGVYAVPAGAHEEIATERGLHARQVQSMGWVGRKIDSEAVQGSKEGSEAARELLRGLRSGSLSHAQFLQRHDQLIGGLHAARPPRVTWAGQSQESEHPYRLSEQLQLFKLLMEKRSAAWQRKEGKDPEGGLNKKGVASYRRENPGSKLKTAVTKDPKKIKKGSKDDKRRKSFCRRMKGMKRKLTSAKTARDPDSRINKSLRKWNC